MSSKVAKIQRYDIESITKFYFNRRKNLPETLSCYPNFGKGFKVYLKSKDNYYIVEKTDFQNNRKGKIYGINYSNGKRSNSISLIKQGKEKGWNVEIPSFDCVTENQVKYNIKELEDLVALKKNQLKQRAQLIEKTSISPEKKKFNQVNKL